MDCYPDGSMQVFPSDDIFGRSNGLLGSAGDPMSTPSPTKECRSPRLGVLCGADAAGAIAGLAIGCFLLLLLLALALLYNGRWKQVGAWSLTASCSTALIFAPLCILLYDLNALALSCCCC